MQVADRRFKARLQSTELGTLTVDKREGRVDRLERIRSLLEGGDIKVSHLIERRAPRGQSRRSRSDRKRLFRVEGDVAAHQCLVGRSTRRGYHHWSTRSGSRLIQLLNRCGARVGNGGIQVGQVDVIARGVGQDDGRACGVQRCGHAGLGGLVVDGGHGSRQACAARGVEGHAHRAAVVRLQGQGIRTGRAERDLHIRTCSRRHPSGGLDRINLICGGLGCSVQHCSHRGGPQRTVDNHGTRRCTVCSPSGGRTGCTCAIGSGVLVVAIHIGAQIARGCNDGLVGVGAHLELLGAERAVQQLGAVEFGGLRDAVELRHQLTHFGLQGLTVAGAVAGVGRLHSQFTHTLQDVTGRLQGAFGRLSQRNAVVGIAHSLVQAADLAGESLRNGQAGCIVLGAVDAQA